MMLLTNWLLLIVAIFAVILVGGHSFLLFILFGLLWIPIFYLICRGQDLAKQAAVRYVNEKGERLRRKGLYFELGCCCRLNLKYSEKLKKSYAKRQVSQEQEGINVNYHHMGSSIIDQEMQPADMKGIVINDEEAQKEMAKL